MKNKMQRGVKANQQIELRILLEMATILPLTEVRDESCGGNSFINEFGISPVTVGQEWFRTEASKIVPVIPVDSLLTGKYRNQLGLTKDKKDKSKQCRETHANDAITLAFLSENEV